jgi:PncC family amidohydrolase
MSDNSEGAKNCLISLKNKRICNFEGETGVISAFSQMGYFFDKISYVAYDNPNEIVSAFDEAKGRYENVVIYFPHGMENTIKTYLSSLYSSSFDGLGIMVSENCHIFMLFSDCDNRLRFSDIKDILDKKYGIRYERTYVKTVGAPIDVINTAIEGAKGICPDLCFNVKNSYSDCTIEILYSSTTSKMALDGALREIVTPLNDYIYALEDITLAERLYQLLTLRRMKICVAESFTGGGVGKKLVEVPGVSSVFIEGLNTYANESKVKRLGVREITLNQYGAVSEQTAYEMADGLISGGNCDVSISTTGIAGPKSDNTNKPVGLIYIGIGTHDNVSVYKYNLDGNRDNITNTAINLALFLAYKHLK